MKTNFALLVSLLLFITACKKDDCRHNEPAPETYPNVKLYTGLNIASTDCSGGNYTRDVTADTLRVTQPNEDSLYVSSLTGENELRFVKESDNGTVATYTRDAGTTFNCYLIAPDSLYIFATSQNVSPFDPQCDLRRDTSQFAGSVTIQ